jgi:hypothetical protein
MLACAGTGQSTCLWPAVLQEKVMCHIGKADCEKKAATVVYIILFNQGNVAATAMY